MPGSFWASRVKLIGPANNQQHGNRLLGRVMNLADR
jgi:hypothetical protein